MIEIVSSITRLVSHTVAAVYYQHAKRMSSGEAYCKFQPAELNTNARTGGLAKKKKNMTEAEKKACWPPVDEPPAAALAQQIYGDLKELLNVAPDEATAVDYERDLLIALSQDPYEKVNVLLLCWKIADSNKYADCQGFKAFLTRELHFNVKIFQIEGTALKPNTKSLAKELHSLHQCSDGQTLSIICYSGHGYSNSANPDRKQRKNLIIF